jgi:uncharacterized protein (DUF1697 family)
MPVFIALIRGINVSGHNPVKMERLRASFEALGFHNVQTYVQSGNVVFKAARAPASGLAGQIAGRILADFGYTVVVVTRTAAELKAVADKNPWLKEPGVDESKLHVTFLASAAPKTADALLTPLAAPGERCLVRGGEVYLYCPHGYGRTKLSNAAIEKKLSVPATTRNWRTVTTLVAMADAGQAH